MKEKPIAFMVETETKARQRALRLKGAHVYPVVELSDTFMNTGWGGRQRPHFLIKRWVTFGGGGGDKALPTAEAPRLGEVKAPDSAEQTPQQTEMQTVTPPTAKEATGDEILF